jgi:UDPglucose 6-dehydrogenase
MDSRKGKNYLKASMGFGGSCLKKDILSLIYILSSRNLEIQANYWTQVVLMNEYQRFRIAESIYKTALKENYQVTIFGLAFKGNTNDTRGSNAIFLISYLINRGIKVKLFDPLVSSSDLENELKLYEFLTDGDLNKKEDNCDSFKININFYEYITIYDNYQESLKNSSILVFCNNHSFFSNLDLLYVSSLMKENSFIFDLYDIFDLENIRKTNFKIFKLGVCNEI